MKLTKKKTDQLYNQIHEDIMQARIKIAKLLNFNPSGKEIDNILSDLTRQAPQNAVDLFKPSEPKKPDEFPEYKTFIDVWHQTYPLILTMPRDGGKIKSIIKQTRTYIKSAGGQLTEENTIIFWQAFVSKLVGTWGHGKNLATIESHYMALIYEMKNGKPKNNYVTAPSAKRIIDSL